MRNFIVAAGILTATIPALAKENVSFSKILTFNTTCKENPTLVICLGAPGYKPGTHSCPGGICVYQIISGKTLINLKVTQ